MANQETFKRGCTGFNTNEPFYPATDRSADSLLGKINVLFSRWGSPCTIRQAIPSDNLRLPIPGHLHPAGPVKDLTLSQSLALIDLRVQGKEIVIGRFENSVTSPIYEGKQKAGTVDHDLIVRVTKNDNDTGNVAGETWSALSDDGEIILIGRDLF